MEELLGPSKQLTQSRTRGSKSFGSTNALICSQDCWSEMRQSLGYVFDEVHLKRGIYAPEGHAQFEDETTMIRRLLLKLLLGEISLPMDVRNFPVDEEEAGEQRKLRQLAYECLEGKRPAVVRVVKDDEQLSRDA